MSVSKEIIAGMRAELESKIKAREGVLDRLALVDIELDLLTGVIADIDADAIALTGVINQSITPVKTAYDARISADCRTNLIWQEQESTIKTIIGSGDSQFITYEVVKNADVYDFEPYHGVKYYRKRSQRDYGSNLIAEFDALVSQGSTIVGINDLDAVPTEIQINDTLVDSFDNPVVFTTGDLPEVVGFGSTEIVGIVTTLVCGINTGSNILRNFGAGDINLVQPGMVVMDPAVTGNDPSYSGTLSNNGWTTITGIGSGTQVIEYYNSAGILTTSTLQVPTLILDKPAQNYLEEGSFRVGILTQVPALFISTAALASYASTTMYVIRNTPDIDADFDYLANPNSPVRIGILGPGDAGIGHSVYYDTSGDENKTERWRPEKERDRIPIQGGKDLPAIKEPKVGAGRADYYIGTTQWPTLTVCTGGGESPLVCSTSYATEGTRVTIGGTDTSTAISYANIGPSGKNPSGSACQALDTAIQTATNSMNSVIAEVQPQAEALVNATKVLRKRRGEKELYAWSLLVSAARLREEINDLKTQIKEMEGFDFTPYEKTSR